MTKAAVKKKATVKKPVSATPSVGITYHNNIVDTLTRRLEEEVTSKNNYRLQAEAYLTNCMVAERESRRLKKVLVSLVVGIAVSFIWLV